MGQGFFNGLGLWGLGSRGSGVCGLGVLGFRALGFNSRVSGFGFNRIPGFLSMCLKKGTFVSERLVLTRGTQERTNGQKGTTGDFDYWPMLSLGFRGLGFLSLGFIGFIEFRGPGFRGLGFIGFIGLIGFFRVQGSRA